MGSDSDLPIMKEAASILTEFQVPHELFLTSAHRSPERTSLFADRAAGRGVKVIIVGAGMAAHLAGVIASQTPLPVIRCPPRFIRVSPSRIRRASFHGADAGRNTCGHDGHRKSGGKKRRIDGNQDTRSGRRNPPREAGCVHQRDG